MHAQLEVFRRYYPELIEKNTVKYPIDDKLIGMMPELHRVAGLRDPPNLKKVLLGCEDFENLIYLWEFFNNFKDFLEIPNIKLEELQAALSFTTDANE